MNKRMIVGIIIALLVVIGAFYFLLNKESSNAVPAPSSGLNIEIKDFAFSPSTLNVKVGDRVTWTNSDSAPHTVTSDSGGELSSGTISADETYSHTFTSAGTYNYHCQFHTGMKSKVIVE
ncbi:MAG: cupredoxin family copper-binding protein [Nanoarchaeota archaeon]